MTGTVPRWYSDRGFGFIRERSTAKRLLGVLAVCLAVSKSCKRADAREI
jgi:hypothetical protein